MKIPLRDDHLILRGGGLAHLVGEDYLFSSNARPEYLFPGSRGQNIYFQPQQIFEKAKKKKRGGGGVSARV